MRILQLHTGYRQRGGEDEAVQSQRDALREAGHLVHELVAENPNGALAAGSALAMASWNPFAAARVERAAAALRPDVAHVHNTWFAMSPSVIWQLHKRRIPIVMTLHNYRLACANSLFLRDGTPCTSCSGRLPLPAIRHRCYRGSRAQSAVAASSIALHRALRTWSTKVDRYIVLSEFARDQFLRVGLPASRMEVGRNFVPDPGPRAESPARSRTILFVGRISPEKGLHVLLAAWRAAALRDMELVVVGDGPARAELQANAPASVTFRGRCDPADVRSQLLAARALVIPSIWFEGQPLVALEGLAAGTPLLLSEIGALPEVIGSSGAGWTFPAASVPALAERLREVALDAEVAERGRRARARFDERFGQDRVVGDLAGAYRRAMEAGR